MKDYKQTVVNAIVEATKEEKIISLRENATAAGIGRMPSQDCRDILTAVKKQTGYRAVKFLTPEQERNRATASLWETLSFVAPEVEFDDGEEEQA